MGFAPPVVPVYDVLETISEKLSRVRYKPLARDFYDLHLLGPTLTFDDLKVVRRLLAFKVAMDYFEGTRRIPIPFNGGADFVGLPPDRITGLDDIGRLAGRLPDPDEMCNKLTQFFGRPMGKPSGALEIRLAKVRPTDAWWVKSKLAEWDLGL
jgi:hypothetical protein